MKMNQSIVLVTLAVLACLSTPCRAEAQRRRVNSLPRQLVALKQREDGSETAAGQLREASRRLVSPKPGEGGSAAQADQLLTKQNL